MGTSYQQSGKTFIAGEALEPHRLVKISAANTVMYADSGDDVNAIGVTTREAANGKDVWVEFLTPGRTFQVTAGAQVTLTSGRKDLVCANDGKVSAYSTGKSRIGTTFQAASGDNSVIEAMLHLEVIPSAVEGS